jgi:DNA polymerase-3 subunit delta'
MLNNIISWQFPAWQQLFSAPAAFPHALLVCGARGIGKLHFVRLAAKALLCEQPGAQFTPCSACASCRWFDQEAHPDLRLIQPESLSREEAIGEGSEDRERGKEKRGGKRISVSQIRDLADFVGLSAHRRGRKVVLLHPAEDLNASAANALLKTLEEPPPGTFFLLTSHRPHGVLATVRSRCRILPMRAPPPAEGMAWLAEQGVEDPSSVLSEAGFAPFRALANADADHVERRKQFLRLLADDTLSPLDVAATLDPDALPDVLGWLHKWTYDLVANRLTGRTRYNLDFAVPLRRIAERADVAQLGRLFRTLARYQSYLGHPLNPKLVFEHLFLAYLTCTELPK